MRLARAIIVLLGLGNALAGLTLLFAPQWFFTNIAPFEPFNRHFMGDIGAFNLPIGVGMIYAAFQPRHHALIALGLAANAVHTLNHLYDSLWPLHDLEHFLRDGLPLLLSTLALGWAYLRFGKGEDNGKSSTAQRV